MTSPPTPSDDTRSLAIREEAAGHSKRSVMGQLAASPTVLVGLALTTLIVVFGLFGRFASPYSPTESASRPYAPPGDGLVLGADALGRDVLSRLLWGGGNLIWMSVLAALVGVLLGCALGMVAAMSGRLTENLVMRGIEVLLAFPSMLLVLLFVSMLGPSPILLVLLVAVTHIAPVARVTRGAVLPLKDKEYVQWARFVGLGRARLIFTEILPNITSPVLVELGLRLMWSVAVFAALSFLGYGIQPPEADWGLMINENQGALRSQPWAMLAPIALIGVFTAGLSLVTEGVSRVLNRTETEQ